MKDNFINLVKPLLPKTDYCSFRFVSKYTNEQGSLTDPAGYHKAMYAAMNADKIAHHFYEQGKADGVKDIIQTSKNPSQDGPRQVADGNVFINGLKVKAISGDNGTKLKFKNKKFISIQNGIRRNFHFNSFPKLQLKNDIVFIFNNSLKNLYQKYITSNFKVIGSFKNNMISLPNICKSKINTGKT